MCMGWVGMSLLRASEFGSHYNYSYCDIMFVVLALSLSREMRYIFGALVVFLHSVRIQTSMLGNKFMRMEVFDTNFHAWE